MKLNLVALILGAAWAVSPRQPASPADLWYWRSAESPQITLDGKLAVFTTGWNDRERNSRFSNLSLVSSDGRQKRPYTQGQWQDSSPRWSPDSTRLAWISDRSGKPQIWTGPAAPGPARAITSLDAQPQAFAWSPDGKWIAFTAQHSPTRIFVITADGGDARLLSTGALDFRGDPAWMPDGQNLVCAERGGEIFAVPLSDGVPRQITHTGQINLDPTPSPDGARIAYTAAGAHSFYSVRRLWVMNADGSRARQLGGTLDRDVRNPQWSNDSRTVYFIADDRGSTHVYLARNDGTVRQLTDRRERLQGLSLADNGRAVTVRSSATEGQALFTFVTDVPAGGWTLLDLDDPFLAERNWGAVEEMPFVSAGRQMQAWLVKPPDFDPTRKYPLLVGMEDTPPRMLGAEFPLRAHIIAAKGFVVLRVNPRGTPGFGEVFGNLLDTEIPAAPAEDAMKAVDAVLAKGFIDPKRITVSAGGSAVWLLGHTDRLASVVARRPIVDFVNYLVDTVNYPSRSALNFAENFKTRTLILAGQKDPQSEKLFAALQKQKVESLIVRAEETPAAQVSEMEKIIAWLH